MINFPSALGSVERQRSADEAPVKTRPAHIVTTNDAVTTNPVTTKHGKYKDPEARKAYQREHMAKVRAAKKKQS